MVYAKLRNYLGNVNIELTVVLLEKAIVDGVNRNAYNFFLGSRVTASSNAFKGVLARIG